MTHTFLGGTCNGSNWRENLIPLLKKNYFNPVVPDWNDEAMLREQNARKENNFCLYVITPKITGFYSIAEVIDDSNKRPEKTVFCFINEDDLEFTTHQIKSLNQIKKMVISNGGNAFDNLLDVANFLNEN